MAGIVNKIYFCSTNVHESVILFNSILKGKKKSEQYVEWVRFETESSVCYPLPILNTKDSPLWEGVIWLYTPIILTYLEQKLTVSSQY